MKYIFPTAIFLLNMTSPYAQDLSPIDPPALQFDSAGQLVIIASRSSSKSDFDFLLGAHTIKHSILNVRLSGSDAWRYFEGTSNAQTFLDGTVNQEVYRLQNGQGKSFEGMALRVFNPQTRLWSIYWVQSDLGTLVQPPEVGYFENNVGFFFSQGVLNGKNGVTVFRWDGRLAGKPVWSQAFSVDGGKTWEWNWFMRYQ